ncbi:MAG: DUF2225 domain-containing protein [Catonella sp.]|jgi:uncharacterized protein (DUF2225 family)|nr:DUF2225 domain-containing protein [Catonella sp.]MDY6356825.1 DUF2225 domain-containing protein [Catonella sp.]
MADIFAGLEKLGFGNLKDVKIYDEPKKKEEGAAGPAANEPHKASEADMLFDKKYNCPVCGNEFKSKAVRAGRAKLDHQDTDLRSVFTPGDINKYNAVACPKCGYAAMDKSFMTLSVRQERAIKDNITPKFKGLPEYGDIYTYDQAIERFQLVLLNDIVKQAKTSERAFVCLKLAWLVRGKSEELDKSAPDYAAQKKALYEEELQYLSNAYDGFKTAISSENFPIAGLDENTLELILGDTARKLGKKDEASRWLSEVITSKTAKEMIKEKARDIRDMIVGSGEKQ